MFKRLWNWVIGHQSVDLNITVEVKDLDKLARVISEFGKNSGIISKSTSSIVQSAPVSSTPIAQQERPKERKKLKDDPIDAGDAAKIFAADGIEKVNDKTGNVISQSEGKSTDDKVSSLKRFNQKKGT